MKTIDRVLLATGLLIRVWLFLGVALTAMGYPGYSHLDQAMSQMGAVAAKAFSDGHLFGLYQRLNYGISIVWIAALSAMALRRMVTS